MASPLDRAWGALEDGDIGSAISAFRRLVQDQPGRESWLGLAHAHRAAEDWAAAAEALRALAECSADRDLVYSACNARAQILDARLGNVPGARAQYEAVLLVDPDRTWPYLALAELDLRQGQWNRALAYASHGLEGAAPFAPERPWLLLCRAAGRVRSNLSVGPVSTFFRQLGGGAHQAEADVALAIRALPRLRELLGEHPLEDPVAIAALVGREMPRPSFPTP